MGSRSCSGRRQQQQGVPLPQLPASRTGKATPLPTSSHSLAWPSPVLLTRPDQVTGMCDAALEEPCTPGQNTSRYDAKKSLIRCHPHTFEVRTLSTFCTPEPVSTTLQQRGGGRQVDDRESQSLACAACPGARIRLHRAGGSRITHHAESSSSSSSSGSSTGSSTGTSSGACPVGARTHPLRCRLGAASFMM